MSIFTVLAGVGAGLSTLSTLDEGKDAARQSKIQQQQYEAEAQAQVIAGQEEARAKREEGKRLRASQLAAISASGGGLVGSNLVVMAETARNVEMDALTIERNSQLRALSLQNQGRIAQYQGQMARKNSRIRAFSNVLGSSAKAYYMYKYS